MKESELLGYWDLNNKLECAPQDITPIERFILNNEPAGALESDTFRREFVQAIAFAETQAQMKIYDRFIKIAKDIKEADMKISFQIAVSSLREIEALIFPESRMKNGHLCGAFCEVCKHTEGDEI